MNVQILKGARADIRRAAQYYEAQRPGLGAEFRQEIRATVERIQQLPEGWPRLDDDYRQCRPERFPYGVIYRLDSEEDLVIVAVSHLHRNPDHWRDRI